MTKKKTVVFILLFAFIFQFAEAIFVTDLIAFSKMAIEFAKQLKDLKKLIETTKKLKDDFKEFKGKFAKIHSGLKKEALKRLLNFKDIEFYFKSPYVRISKDSRWINIWKNTENLFKKYPYLKDFSVFKGSPLYRTNGEYRKRADYRIKMETGIYSEYEKTLKMIADSREIISGGIKKYKSMEKMITKFSNQRSTGKLIGLTAGLKLQQMIKLDLLITSIRMKMELMIKEKIMRMDLAKKREIEIRSDRDNDKKILGNIL